VIEPVTLVLPFPPSVNGYWRHVTVNGSKRTLISKAGRNYRDTVITSVRYSPEALANGCIRGERLAATITLHRGDRRQYDVDNHAKGIFDSLTHAGFWEDDSLVDWLLIRRGYVDKENPRAIVEICGHLE
jgi:crossover junction endodeoxyribonuclease RusA